MDSDLFAPLRSVPAEPLTPPRRALAIGAHPDDAEFGAGGTLARWASAGCAVSLVVMTDGSKGTWDVELDPAELTRARRQEQIEAASVLGISDLVFFDHPDGELEYSMELRRQVAGEIRRLRPEVVLSHDPWALYELHPDHRATGWAAVDGVIAARDHLFFPELEDPAHRPDWLLLWTPAQADHWEDIATSFDTKVEALLKHTSQGETTMAGAGEGEEAFTSRLRAWATEQGAPAGLEVAESFRRLRP